MPPKLTKRERRTIIWDDSGFTIHELDEDEISEDEDQEECP